LVVCKYVVYLYQIKQMETKKHIFEIKEMMNDTTGWSNITPDEFYKLDFFTKEYILDTIEDRENFDPSFHDITLGGGHMFWVDVEKEGQW